MLVSRARTAVIRNFALPQQQDQQISTHTQSAFPPLNKPQGVSVQYQLSRNDFTPPAGAKSNSNVIAEAQLTHFFSRDDDAQRQDATSDQDAPMPDAPTAHEIATPRRTIGRRCRKWCISAQPASRKRKCIACCMCGT